ncbi:MAG: DMT family transporter [Rhodocyclaceae bacterium]
MPAQTGSRARGMLLMLCTGLLWSTAGVLTRHIHHVPGAELTFWRSAFCAVAMAVIVTVVHRGDALARCLRIGRAGVLSGLLWAVMFTCFMLALTRTGTANTLIITSLSPLAAGLFGWLLLGERPARRTWVSIGLAASGIAIMFGGDLDAEGSRMTGNLIALLVPLAAGLNFVLLRAARTRVDLMPAVLIGGSVSALAMLPLVLPFRAPAQDLALLAFLGAFQLALPCALAVAAVRHLSAAEAALIGLSENVFGPLWAWLGAGETPSRNALIGGTVVLVALIGQAARGMRRSPAIRLE